MQRGGRYGAATNVLAQIESLGLSVFQEDGTEVGQNMKMLTPGPFFGSSGIERGSRSAQLGREL